MSPIQRRTLCLGLLAIGMSVSATSRAQPSTESVSLETARAEAAAGRAVLIDIREPDETARGVAAGAVLLPMSQLKARWAEIPVDPGKPVFLVCNTQNRSRATLKALRERGYGHVRYVEGGMSEWVRRGWPLVTPGR
jgi:rhodanese-related sulfurtransferase